MSKKNKNLSKEEVKKTPTKIDISCTADVPAGFTRVPLESLPDESVEEISCSFLFNRIPANKRLKFMEEVSRVLIKGGKIMITVPYWSSMRSIQDYGHEWPPVVEQSFLYFNKVWRDQQKFDKAFADDSLKPWLNSQLYESTCDFDFTFGYIYDPETSTRADDVKPHWVKHYINAVGDLQVVLTKK